MSRTSNIKNREARRKREAQRIAQSQARVEELAMMQPDRAPVPDFRDTPEHILDLAIRRARVFR